MAWLRPQTRDGEEVAVAADVVVLATGYRQTFPFLKRASDGLDDALPTEHFICDPDEPDLAFFGFARPNVGAIPPMAELQAMWWVAKLQGRATGPRVPSAPYKLTNCRLSYGVDYGLYMFSLAREIGAAPNLARWLLERPAVALACAFGQAHAPLFRLDGPFARDDAAGQERPRPKHCGMRLVSRRRRLRECVLRGPRRRVGR